MTRRRALVAGGAALCAAAVAGPPGAMDGEQAVLRERLLGIFGDRVAARRLGLLYLATHPHEGDRDRLLSRLLAGGDGRVLPSMGAEELHADLRARLRCDFVAGRTVWVDGVLLGETEARLFALAALA